MLTPEKTAELLGRSLTTLETSNFKTYIEIAKQRLEELLCMNLSADADERTYLTRKNYRSVMVDPFTEIVGVTIDDEELDAEDYTIAQNDNLNGLWYNTIVFETARTGEKIVVDADWGFGDACPTDLELLLARLFAQNSVEHTQDNQVKSKKIEDFTVTYKDSNTIDELISANKSVIDKYSTCNQGYIRHGSVSAIYYN